MTPDEKWPSLSLESLAYPERVIANMAKHTQVTESGCHEWTATRNNRGYGNLCVKLIDGREAKQYAHRLAYVLHVGPIPQGMQIDHLCRVKHCVNPEHLEVVTARTNMLRIPFMKEIVERNCCARGHEYVEGSYWIRDERKRVCLVCSRMRARQRYVPKAQRKEAS